MADTQVSSTEASSTKAAQRCRVIPYPKVVFFYPLMFTAIICSFFQYFYPSKIIMPTTPQPTTAADTNKDEPVEKEKYVITILKTDTPEAAKSSIKTSEGDVPIFRVEGINTIAGSVFILVFLLNILVISFDFPGLKALVLALVILLVVVLLWKLELLGPIGKQLSLLSGTLYASWVFYAMIAGIIAIMIFSGIFYNRMFNQWIVESNRLLHRHGFLGDFTEYPVVDLQLDKDIDDVLEHVLLFSGTLTFRPNPTTPPIRLENVPGINGKERKIRNLIRKIQVKED